METKTDTLVLIKKSLRYLFCSMTDSGVSLNVIKLEPVRIKSKLVNTFCG